VGVDDPSAVHEKRTGFPGTPPNRRDPAGLPGLFFLVRGHRADELGPGGWGGESLNPSDRKIVRVRIPPRARR
jgi:hypothetical protein